MIPGRITPLKGQQILLNAYTLMPEDRKKDLVIVLAGGVDERYGSYLHDLEVFIESKGLRHVVIRTDYLSQEMLAKANKAATHVILPTFKEALGRVILEAGAMRKTVITSNVGGSNVQRRTNFGGLYTTQISRCPHRDISSFFELAYRSWFNRQGL